MWALPDRETHGTTPPGDNHDSGHAGRRQIGELLARLSDDDLNDTKERGRLLAALAAALASSARTAGAAAVVGGRWLADVFLDVAPRLPVRDRARLRAQHAGMSDDAIAQRLAAAAIRATTAVGVAGGALAAVEFTAPPTLLTAPVQLAAETLAVAAIEVKLVTELHELYGIRPSGNRGDRTLAYVTAWANRRGIDPLNPLTYRYGLGTVAKRQIRQRLLGRARRNVSTMFPFLVGAAAGGAVNRRETRLLAERILADLRAARAGHVTSSMPGGSWPVEFRQ
jgi:hypothetical protein